jgi:hypothetical protein
MVAPLTIRNWQISAGFRLGINDQGDVPFSLMPGRPVLSSGTFSLAPNYEMKALLGRVIGTNGPTSFAITGGNGDNLFAIDTGGYIRTSATKEVPPGNYSIRVIARNAAGASAPTLFALTLQAAVTHPSAWPTGWDDSRYAANASGAPALNSGNQMVTWRDLTVIDMSGNPSFGYANYNLLNSRIRTREGPRVSGSNILIDGCYIEVVGVVGDHADGIQAYGGSSQANMKSIVIRNTKVVLTGSGLNAGIFFADHSGAELTLENVYVDGRGSPNGAIWLANVVGDVGCRSLIARNVVVAADSSGTFSGRYFRVGPTAGLCNIIEWTNVRRDDGTPIAKPT